MKDWREIDGWLFEEEAELLQRYGAIAEFDIVELGVYKGKSSVALSKRYTGKEHFAVDTFDGRATTKEENTYEEFLDNIEYFTSHIIPIKMTTSQFSDIYTGVISLLFIDADHSYEAVKEDFNNFIERVEIYGYIIFHDAYGEDGPVDTRIPWPGVHKFCQELQSDPRVKLIESVRRCAVFQRIE